MLRASEALARGNVERVQLALAAGAIIGTWHWDLTKPFAIDSLSTRVRHLMFSDTGPGDPASSSRLII
jgi:hypothetical protein